MFLANAFGEECGVVAGAHVVAERNRWTAIEILEIPEAVEGPVPRGCDLVGLPRRQRLRRVGQYPSDKLGELSGPNDGEKPQSAHFWEAFCHLHRVNPAQKLGVRGVGVRHNERLRR